jgi:hypothetical protein
MRDLNRLLCLMLVSGGCGPLASGGGRPDAGLDAGVGSADSGSADSGSPDAGDPDGGTQPGDPHEADVHCSGMHPAFADVQMVFRSNCSGVEGCHGFAEPLGWLVNKPSTCGSATLIVPGAPRKSYVMNKLLDQDICGKPMPLRVDAWRELPADQIQLLVDWICDGALN